MHRAGIKSQVGEALLRLETNGTNISDLDDGSPELMISSIENRGEKSNDANYGRYDLLRNFNKLMTLSKR